MMSRKDIEKLGRLIKIQKIKVDKETAKVLDKLNKMRKTQVEKLEYKMAGFDEPLLLSEVAKAFKKSKADTMKLLIKLIKSGIVSVSLTKAEKFLRK